MQNKNILMFLPAKDFNETEYLTVKKHLDKVQLPVFIASDANALCSGKNGLKVKADVSLYNVHECNFSGIIFIGGKGIKKYWDNAVLHNISNQFVQSDKLVAAICSAPVILAKAGLLSNLSSTCYPDDREELESEGARYEDSPLIVENNIITARDSMASSDFANAIIDKILCKS